MQNENKANDSLEKYTSNPWSLYDRISSVKLHNINGEKGKDEVFKGIMIGQRQIMGIKDTYVVPIVTGLVIIALGFAFISKFTTKDENGKANGRNPTFWILDLVFVVLGLAIGGYLLYQGIKGRAYNRKYGMSAVYLDPEKKVLAIRDIQGDDVILPMKHILSFFRVSAFELTIFGIGVKVFPRLFLHYQDEDGKKLWKIVHFLDQPEEVVHTFDAIQFEYRGEEEENQEDKK